MRLATSSLIAAAIASVAAISLALGQAAPAGAPATSAAKSPLADGAKPVQLAGGFGFTEGSTSDKDGNIYFVDQNNDKILKWVFEPTADDPTKGHLETFMNPAGRSNGMCFDNDGNLISCADEKNELWLIAAPLPKVDPAKPFTKADLKITTLIKDYDPAAKKLNPDTGGKPLNGPNDVWVIPAGPQKGGMYITDPLYARNWWGSRPGGRGMQQAGKYVYFLAPDHKTLTPVVTDYTTPNGVIGTPDGKTLYVADIDARRTFSFTIKDDGTLADKKPFCNAGSDGMTIDSDGNIYTTNSNARQGVQIFNKEGQQIDQIPIGSANCCFGGKDGNVLFICSNSPPAVFGVKMKTHRVGPQ